MGSYVYSMAVLLMKDVLKSVIIMIIPGFLFVFMILILPKLYADNWDTFLVNELMHGMHVMLYFHTDTVNLKDDAYIGEENEPLTWPELWQCGGSEASVYQCTWLGIRNNCSHVGVICQHIGMRTKYYATIMPS